VSPAADVKPLIQDSLLRTILSELSAENAVMQTAAISSHARYPNSQGFFDAAEYVAARAREFGLPNVRIERLPASEPMWDQEEALLEVVGRAAARIPAALAQHSADGDFTAQLLDTRAGVSADKIRGNVLFTDEEPDLAWKKYRSRAPAAAKESGGSRAQELKIFWF